MKSIHTLIDDIHAILENGGTAFEPERAAKEAGNSVSQTLATRVAERDGGGYLRLSSIGKPCARQLWYEINEPEGGEKFDGVTLTKFLYGDMTEEAILFLCKAAGHDVLGEQDTLVLEGVSGHRDAVIDGNVVDVKSASRYSFGKFKDGTLAQDDPFGYLDQGGSYLLASQDDPLVTNKESMFFLALNKESGEMCLYEHKPDFDKLIHRIAERKSVVSGPIPPRHFTDEVDGKSGNYKLGLNCSYCSRKWECWPGLRGFVYSGKPRYLTRVVKRPQPHIKEFGE